VKVGAEKVPVCYANDGTKDIISVYPDSSVGAFSFFETEGPAVPPDDEDNWYVYSLSVTVWFNLDLVYPNLGYDYTHELIEDVKDKLDEGYCHEIEVEERPEDIFEKFDGITKDFEYLTPPYGAFKLKFIIEK
jgi:hypothetical protein